MMRQRSERSELSASEAAAVFATYLPNLKPDRRGRCRARATYRGGHNLTSLAIDTERDLWYDHATGEGGDSISFVMKVLGTDFRGACREITQIVGRDVLEEGSRPVRRRVSDAVLTKAELFKVGFLWRLEQYLALLKQELWMMPDPFAEADDRVRRFTALLTEAQRWRSYELTEFYLRLKQRKPGFVKACVHEALQFHLKLATAIAEFGSRTHVTWER